MFDWINGSIDHIIFALITPGIVIGALMMFLQTLLPTPLIQWKMPLLIGGLCLVLFFTYEAGRSEEVEDVEQKNNAVLIEYYRNQEKKYVLVDKVITKYVDKVKVVERIKEVPVNVYVDKIADERCVIDSKTSDNIRTLWNNAADGQLPN